MGLYIVATKGRVLLTIVSYDYEELAWKVGFEPFFLGFSGFWGGGEGREGGGGGGRKEGRRGVGLYVILGGWKLSGMGEGFLGGWERCFWEVARLREGVWVYGGGGFITTLFVRII